MANAKYPYLQLLFFTLFCAAAFLVKGSSLRAGLHSNPTAYDLLSAEREPKHKDNAGRLLIGSAAPRCTYNECRGCKYRCRAEQIPVEGNDPINSAYNYKCLS